AKMHEPWTAKWITPPWPQGQDDSPHPYIRKQFAVGKNVAKARMYMTGLGIYELFVNGARIGDEVFAPYCNTYDAWVQYQTYDITAALQTDENAVGVMLANGWAKGRFGTFGPRNTPYTHHFSLIGEVHITYEDGTTEVINTDESWLCAPSPLLFDNMYDGVIYDATEEIEGWSSPGLDETNWLPAQHRHPHELGALTERLSPAVKCMEEVTPIAVLTTPAGETVLDMGQNMVGWLKMRIRAPKGTKITITHGEILQQDNFYTENLRSAKQKFVYIADGTDQVVEPRFSFYGFRYAKIEGIDNVQLADFTGCVLYSNLETTGNIETSDPRINRLFQNALWGQKGNFVDVPTDCPQRDERMGWTGDTQVFAGTAMFNMDAYAFYVKFMYDLYQEQRFCGGLVPSVVPIFVQRRPIETGDWGTGGSCAWSDCATIVPWEVYMHSGDETILKNQYQSMKDWVDWVTRKCERDDTGYLWTQGFHFGDWLALDGEKDEHGRSINPMGATSVGFLASAFYRYSSMLLAKTAALLGRHADQVKYADLSARVRNAMQAEFFTPDGDLKINTQTAHVIAIQFDLTDNKRAMVAGLKKLLEASNMHLTTGFIGTPFLCRVLSAYGESDSAYQIFFNEDYPSWLYPVSMGATTIWERWNSVMPDGSISDTGMNSLNHYAYGSIAEWMYRDMCGINPVESAPGFKKILLKPEPNRRLAFAHGEVNTAMGVVKCGWEYKGDTIVVTAHVPFNTTADLILPNGESKTLDAGHHAFEIQDLGDIAARNIAREVK
ncbi:MAG: glycoside hydrolase family 78 protein, partial [Defluviitaleaceae bacterium]|nr:glycoside hydrolase family 78 protein [Defluviitaleaceae bacterium]